MAAAVIRETTTSPPQTTTATLPSPTRARSLASTSPPPSPNRALLPQSPESRSSGRPPCSEVAPPLQRRLPPLRRAGHVPRSPPLQIQWPSSEEHASTLPCKSPSKVTSSPDPAAVLRGRVPPLRRAGRLTSSSARGWRVHGQDMPADSGRGHGRRNTLAGAGM